MLGWIGIGLTPVHRPSESLLVWIGTLTSQVRVTLSQQMKYIVSKKNHPSLDPV